MDKLKPCPFCGQIPQLVWWDVEADGWEREKAYEPGDDDFRTITLYVHCYGCDTEVYFSLPKMSASEIIKTWNRRADNG